jgi:hypothetical protein
VYIVKAVTAAGELAGAKKEEFVRITEFVATRIAKD